MTQYKQSESAKRPRSMTTHLTPAVILGVIALLLMLAYSLLDHFKIERSNPLLHPLVGKRIEHIKLLPLTGAEKPISKEDIKDHVVLINLWQIYCPPCRKELPHIAELRERYAGQESFLLLSVSWPHDAWDGDVESFSEETAALLEKLHVDMPTYYAPGAADPRFRLGGVIDIQFFPTTVLLDREGVIRACWVGYYSGLETEMERYIGELLERGRKP